MKILSKIFHFANFEFVETVNFPHEIKTDKMKHKFSLLAIFITATKKEFMTDTLLSHVYQSVNDNFSPYHNAPHKINWEVL